MLKQEEKEEEEEVLTEDNEQTKMWGLECVT